MSDAFFVFDVIIHRGIHRAEAVGIADVFQIEQEILAPVQFLPAQHAVVPDERRAVQLIPQHTVVEAGRFVHQLPRKFALVHHVAAF